MRLVLLSLCLLPSLLQAASFDCSRTEHPVELAICGNAALSELDERLAATFQRARGFSAEGDDSWLVIEGRRLLKSGGFGTSRPGLVWYLNEAESCDEPLVREAIALCLAEMETATQVLRGAL